MSHPPYIMINGDRRGWQAAGATAAGATDRLIMTLVGLTRRKA